MNEEWMEQMRQKMADYQWPAPELLWEELDKALTTNNPRNNHLPWLRRMAAAAVVLLIVGVGYWGFLKDNGDRLHNPDLKQALILEHVAENHEDWHNDSSAVKIRVPAPVILTSSAQNSTISEEPALESETITPTSTISPDTVNPTAPEEVGQPYAEEEKAKPIDNTPSVIYPSDLHQRKHIDNRLTAKVYMSSTMAGSRRESYYDQEQTDDIIPIINIRHHQPGRFGLSFRYWLDYHGSIESGLSYTRLSSDISTTVNGMTTMTEQRLYYIGLPLNISYDLWKSNYFGLYVTAGGTIEKSLNTSPWQLSLNGAVGAEYKLTNTLSLYAEPGLGYYFKDGSTTPTIYQDYPLNFNLSFGLRFNLK